jgi:hypothetical protein
MIISLRINNRQGVIMSNVSNRDKTSNVFLYQKSFQ